MGLGPRGQPISANHLNKGIGMGNLGPTAMGMEGRGFGINKIGNTGDLLVVVWETWVDLDLDEHGQNKWWRYLQCL